MGIQISLAKETDFTHNRGQSVVQYAKEKITFTAIFQNTHI